MAGRQNLFGPESSNLDDRKVKDQYYLFAPCSWNSPAQRRGGKRTIIQ
ncbi:MAG TPA: hypothetical protein VHZ51_06030 [Ktedonobacteraceae bacterium]|nr:hypothetical protein [Ktedonobacteraceae bacterium]